jgi:hypothetical protein
MRNAYYKTTLILFVYLAIISAAVIAWFSPIRTHTFMGDDLQIIQRSQAHTFATSIWSDMINGEGYKFRPISNAAIGALVRSCDMNFDCYNNFNLGLFIINISILSFVVNQMTGSLWLSLVFSPIVFLVSRFSYYSAITILGIMENMGMTFVLLFVLTIYKFVRNRRYRWIVLSIFLYVLLICTHERFIVLSIPIILTVYIYRKSMTNLKRICTVASTVMVPILNVVIKEYLLKMPFLVGSGGTYISQTFTLIGFLKFILKGNVNLGGLNAGPTYLSGKYFREAGQPGIYLAVFLTGSIFILFGIYFYKYFRSQSNEAENYKFIILLLITIECLIAASSITIRQEYRWLYTPFAVLIILVCYLLPKLSPIKLQIGLTIILLISFVSVDVYYRQYVGNIFFIAGMRTTDSIKANIIDRFTANELTTSSVIIVTHGNNDIKNWYIFTDYFFILYAKIPMIDLHYVNEVEQITRTSAPNKRMLIFSVDGTNVTDITKVYLQKN